MTAITSASHFLAQTFDANPKTADAPSQQDTPAQGTAADIHAAVPADGTSVMRSKSLPLNSSLPPSIALQLKQRCPSSSAPFLNRPTAQPAFTPAGGAGSTTRPASKSLPPDSALQPSMVFQTKQPRSSHSDLSLDRSATQPAFTQAGGAGSTTRPVFGLPEFKPPSGGGCPVNPPVTPTPPTIGPAPTPAQPKNSWFSKMKNIFELPGKLVMKLVSASLHVVRVVKVIQAFGKGTKEIMKIFKGEVGLFKNILDKIHSKMSKAAEFLYHVGESIKSNKLLGRISKFLAKTGKSLIKGIGKPFIKALGKYAGPLGILFMIGDGIKNLFNPDHTGWRGWVDRLLVGVGGIVCGALLGLAMLGAVTLAPVVLTIIAIVTAAITIWQLGNLIYDNRENISGWMSHVGAS